ncbi:hypothetical protein [Hyphomicrobium sp. 2TAF46]|uniref:hypothetical protein n=1 Tax=Hyphomicrobium sp. 2TAF46 TaxID=3233019 RepID=UPI003F8EB738
MNQKATQITNINFERFEAAFVSTDDIGIVVRCEYEIERAAYRALSAMVPKYDKFKHRYLSDHLKTFRAFNFSGPIFQVADYVRKVRNEFAHDGIEQITEQHVKELCSQAGSGFGGRPILDWTLGLGMWGAKRETKWSEFNSRQQFVLISATDAAAIDTLPQRIPQTLRLDHLSEL